MSEDPQLVKGKDLVGRIFKYLRALHARKTPPTSELSNHPWSIYLDELPSHLAIIFKTPIAASKPSVEDGDAFTLSVARPKETKCPGPPRVLRDWLITGWDTFGKQPELLEARNIENLLGQTRTERFDEDSERQKALETWREQRCAWEEAERPTRRVLAIFSRLFDLHGMMQRDAEKYQLWLADGHLQWRIGSKVISHPLLLQRVELQFDPKTPSFSIIESAEPPELHAAILRYCELDGRLINELSQAIKTTPCHPLGVDETDTYLGQLVHIFWENGELDSKGLGPMEIPSEKPVISRRPVLFLGSRAQGFDAAMSRIESYLEDAPEIPESLMRIVGLDRKADTSQTVPLSAGGVSTAAATDSLSLAPDVMLTKPANEEQIRVIRKLAGSGSVIVQGPPGTGKTHTIANLIGHLLAEGKTVLVTSNKSRALRVVREKVHESLRPLCVSVLDSDENSRRELEDSISGIVGYLSRTDRSKLDAELLILETRRLLLIERHNQLVRDLLRAKRSEYDDLVCGGDHVSPSVGARFLVDHPNLGWIPGPVTEGSVLPLLHEEILDLYASSVDVSAAIDSILAHPLPSPGLLPQEGEFAEIAAELVALMQREDVLSAGTDTGVNDIGALRAILSSGRAFQASIAAGEPWFLEALLAGLAGGAQDELWRGLSNLLRSRRDELVRRREIIITYGPTYSGDADRQELAGVALKIAGHLEGGGSVSMLSTIFKGSWKQLIANHRVNGQSPKVAVHFRAIAALHETYAIREEVALRWTRQMECHQAPPAANFKETIEDFIQPFSERIDRALNWAKEVWEPFSKDARTCGLAWDAIEREESDRSLGSTPINRLKAILAGVLVRVEARIAYLRQEELRRLKHDLSAYLLSFYGNSHISHPVFELRTAVETDDAVLYKRARRRLVDVTSLEKRMKRRIDLIQRLEATAPAWAMAIRARQEPHEKGQPPGDDIESAWKFRQWACQLATRHRVAIDDLQKELMGARDELYQVSAKFVEKLAWRAQTERTGLRQRQALVGWLDIQRKIGKGTGKRVPRLQAEARQLLIECKDAVPVWIMPTSRVYESFDPTRARFDVLILDEASQCDVTDVALFAFAKDVVVVGDHEQVSPPAVGQEIASMQALIDEFLVGVPNAIQYDPKTSVYHLARQSFGETIRLVEHFRCVPDIIAFSNALSYSGEIRPLREAAAAQVQPPMISHRVFQASSQGKVNLAEIDEVSALILAADEHEAYADLTIGVISMVGIDQALRIEENLRRHLPPDRYATRRILCGNASQFQGDERDVMFISMVDANAGSAGPLRMDRNTDDWRKAFNVAASRARDQLWVVHSLSPDTDLKNDDTRKRLIRHAENPSATKSQMNRVDARAESEFERLVARGLTDAGFRIQMQWEVGAYRIDMVIHDAHHRRVALECDGDRWHPPEKHADDLARQFVLERLGWRFVRIRGSEFFSNRAAALTRLIGRIKDLGVEPDLLEEAATALGEVPMEDRVKREVIAAAEIWRDKLRMLRISGVNPHDEVDKDTKG